eukprot:365387-Chlamydomonas_euryale.AAC.19
MNSSNESRGKLLQFGVPGLIAILWELSPTLFPTSIYPTAGRNLREIKAAEDARVQQQLAEGAAPRTSAPEREEQPVGAAKRGNAGRACRQAQHGEAPAVRRALVGTAGRRGADGAGSAGGRSAVKRRRGAVRFWAQQGGAALAVQEVPVCAAQ